MSKKIRSVLVGLNFGRYMLEYAITQGPGEPFIELAGVCDIDAEKVAETAKKYSCRAYEDLDAVLNDESIRAILLFTGPNGRADLIRRILRAGKDVLTTKPFEQDASAAISVLREARELGRIVYLNSPGPVPSADFTQIRLWEKHYALGRLVGAHHECWYKSVEHADGSWYDNRDLCPVAPVLRLGIYGLNDLLQFFGEPVEVQVMETRLFTGRPTPDMARLSIKFADGAIADTLDGWAHQPARGAQSLILYYENGTIYRNPPLFGEGSGDPGGEPTVLCVTTKDQPDGRPAETVKLGAENLSSQYPWAAFHRAVTSGERPENETPDSVIVNAVRIVEAMRRAQSQGGVAKV